MYLSVPLYLFILLCISVCMCVCVCVCVCPSLSGSVWRWPQVVRRLTINSFCVVKLRANFKTLLVLGWSELSRRGGADNYDQNEVPSVLQQLLSHDANITPDRISDKHERFPASEDPYLSTHVSLSFVLYVSLIRCIPLCLPVSTCL